MVVLFPDAFIENRLTDTGAGLGVAGGESGTSGESNMEEFTLPYVK